MRVRPVGDEFRREVLAATASPKESIEYRPGIGPSDSMSAEMSMSDRASAGS